jgi:hypothetical protein
MDPATIASLINLGGAGAVIIVVILFLKYLQKRDEEWRAFFVEISRGTATETQRLVVSIDKLAEKLDDHDKAVQPRIETAVNSAVDTILSGTTPRRRATDKRS